ncbi:flavodoxin [Pedobacter chinensis]|uniref:Flavodoxin n=2 Tax=Pedobacter chinensis TaxID=2282421 RepID=A0A369PWV3_9SPHI|nr:flavodoxin [Pedobacter chinensis]
MTSYSNAQTPVDKKKILIVYLSRTKNTKTVAEMIYQKVGGTLVELETENPYPGDYQKTVDQVAEENRTGYLPPLKTKIDSVEKFDVVFIGFPTWGMELPPPMKSFLRQNDLKGKTVVPFNTNAGYGVGNGFNTVKGLCPESRVPEGFSMEGGKERDGILFVMEGEKHIEVQKKVVMWLEKIKIAHP